MPRAIEAARWEHVQRQLSEGQAVDIDGVVVRFFPSFRAVAAAHGISPSTVARWARRHGVLEARRARVAAERAAPEVGAATMTRYFGETIALVKARWEVRRKPPSVRQVEVLVRAMECVVGTRTARPGLLRRVERMREDALAAARRS